MAVTIKYVCSDNKEFDNEDEANLYEGLLDLKDWYYSAENCIRYGKTTAIVPFDHIVTWLVKNNSKVNEILEVTAFTKAKELSDICP